MTDWQPIETAPQDGTRILAFSRLTGERWVAHFDRRWQIAFFRSSVGSNMHLTHWMPLPEPPR